MKMWQLHKAIEDLGLAEHGDKNVVIDMNDGRYAPVKKLEQLIGPLPLKVKFDEIVIRIR